MDQDLKATLSRIAEAFGRLAPKVDRADLGLLTASTKIGVPVEGGKKLE